MERNWSLVPWEARRKFWWRCILSCNRNSRTAGIMERSWDLLPCSMVRVPEESPRKPIGESDAWFQQRPQHFWKEECHLKNTKSSSICGVEGRQPVPQRQSLCAVGHRSFSLTLPKAVGTWKIVRLRSLTVSFTLLDLVWLCFSLIVLVHWYSSPGERQL